MALNLFIEVTNPERHVRQWINPDQITKIVANAFFDDKKRGVSSLEISLVGQAESVTVTQKSEIASLLQNLGATRAT